MFLGPRVPSQLSCLECLALQAEAGKTWEGKGNQWGIMTRAGLTKRVVGAVRMTLFPPVSEGVGDVVQ